MYTFDHMLSIWRIIRVSGLDLSLCSAYWMCIKLRESLRSVRSSQSQQSPADLSVAGVNAPLAMCALAVYGYPEELLDSFTTPESHSALLCCYECEVLDRVKTEQCCWVPPHTCTHALFQYARFLKQPGETAKSKTSWVQIPKMCRGHNWASSLGRSDVYTVSLCVLLACALSLSVSLSVSRSGAPCLSRCLACARPVSLGVSLARALWAI